MTDWPCEFTVKTLREYLAEFDDNAKVTVNVKGIPTRFKLLYYGKDDSTKKDAEGVVVDVE